MSIDIRSLVSRANTYKEVLNNTLTYREEWQSKLKQSVKEILSEVIAQTGLKAEIKVNDKIENLESIVFDLGKSSSGISEHIEGSGVKRTMVKNNGSLIYQQLFNGKIMVMILSPFIEGYGESKAPRMLEILKPVELKQPFVLRHIELLLKDITDWEDYDDDQPHATIGFQPIGFNREDPEA